MTDEKRKKGDGQQGGEKGSRKGGLAAWQIALVVVAVLVMGAGIAIGVMGGGGTPAPAGATSSGVTPNGLVRGLTPVEGGGATAPGAQGDGVNWSPVVFRLGFGAFVGFAIGFALRSFLKFSLFALGFFFLMLLGLQYAQVIEIHWGAMEARYDEASTWIGAQTEGFMGFVTGQLPAAGVGLAGLVAGLKRR